MALTISEEISVRRLVSPSRNTVRPTLIHVRREPSTARFFLSSSPAFSAWYMKFEIRDAMRRQDGWRKAACRPASIPAIGICELSHDHGELTSAGALLYVTNESVRAWNNECSRVRSAMPEPR